MASNPTRIVVPHYATPTISSTSKVTSNLRVLYVPNSAPAKDTSKTKRNKAPESPTKMPLDRGPMKLPPELRLLIYEAVLATFNIDWDRQKDHNVLREPALLAACKTIRAEAMKIYFDRMRDILTEMRSRCDIVLVNRDAWCTKREHQFALTGQLGNAYTFRHLIRDYREMSSVYEKVRKLIEVKVKRWEDVDIGVGAGEKKKPTAPWAGGARVKWA